MSAERGDVHAALMSAYWAGEDFRRRSRQKPLPDDVPAFVNDARRRARAVPEGLSSLNFESKIIRYCEFAEHYLEIGDEAKLREFCYLIKVNLDHLDHDIEVHNILHGKRRGGSASKKNPYATTVAQYLCLQFPTATYDQIWENLTSRPWGCITHAEGTPAELDIAFYREGGKLWIRAGASEPSFTKSTFEKQYLRPARQATKKPESK